MSAKAGINIGRRKPINNRRNSYETGIETKHRKCYQREKRMAWHGERQTGLRKKSVSEKAYNNQLAEAIGEEGEKQSREGESGHGSWRKQRMTAAERRHLKATKA